MAAVFEIIGHVANVGSGPSAIGDYGPQLDGAASPKLLRFRSIDMEWTFYRPPLLLFHPSVRLM